MSDSLQNVNPDPDREDELASLLEQYGQLISKHGISSDEAAEFVAQHQQYPEFQELARTAADLKTVANERKADQNRRRRRQRAFALLVPGLFVVLLLAFAATLWGISRSTAVRVEEAEDLKKNAVREARKIKEKAEKLGKKKKKDIILNAERKKEEIIAYANKEASSIKLSAVNLQKEAVSLKKEAVSLKEEAVALKKNAVVKSKEIMDEAEKMEETIIAEANKKKEAIIAAAKKQAGSIKENAIPHRADLSGQTVSLAINALKSKNPHLVKFGTEYMQQNIEKLPPATAKEAVPMLVSVLNSQDSAQLYAKSALWKLGYKADRITASYLKKVILKSSSEHARQLLTKLESQKHYPRTADPIIPVKINVPVYGELTAKDEYDRIQRKSHSKVYAVELQPGSSYVLDLKSKDFDTYLRIEGLRGVEFAADDDSGQKLNSRIFFQPEKGSKNYHVIVTSYFPHTTGKFALFIQQTENPQVERLELTKRDQFDSHRTRSHSKSIAMTFEKGYTYVIDLESTDFDTYMRLESPSGKILASDDDGGKGLNSRLFFIPEQDCSCNIVVTTYMPGDTGRFTLSVFGVKTPSLPQSDTP